MGLNQLQLSPELVATLYPESLVLVPDEKKEKILAPFRELPTVQEPVYSFLGKNLQSICILVSYPEEKFMPDGELLFLKKILTACKFSLDDIALVNTKQLPVSPEAIKKQFLPHNIILWGDSVHHFSTDISLRDMVISPWGNISVLPVFKAGQMSIDSPESTELKKALWVSLKKLFNL